MSRFTIGSAIIGGAIGTTIAVCNPLTKIAYKIEKSKSNKKNVYLYKIGLLGGIIGFIIGLGYGYNITYLGNKYQLTHVEVETLKKELFKLNNKINSLMNVRR